MNNWCTIESDPAVFSELLSEIGVKGTEVTEIYSLDENEQSTLEGKSYGLIFLFKWRQETDDRPVLDPVDCPDLFFAQQVVTNACATQAILSVVLNADNEIEIGQTLRDFKAFVGHFDAETKGETISNSNEIRTAHNSFARPEPFVGEEKPKVATDKDDVFHFIAYVPHKGFVYELDGLKSGPIMLGAYDHGVDWRTVAKPAIEARMQRYAASETHFALLTIARSRADILAEQLATVEANGGDTGELLLEIRDEAQRQEKQKEENARRKHNYVPFVMELLKQLALKGKLPAMVTAAQEHALSRSAAKQIADNSSS